MIRRSAFEQKMAIINALQEPTLLTTLRDKTGINYDVMKKHVLQLEASGLVRQTPHRINLSYRGAQKRRNGIAYIRTSHGYGTLALFEEIKRRIIGVR